MNREIAQIEKNSTEVIRVEIFEYKGFDLVGMRVYVSREGEDPAPTRKGITCNVALIPELKKALAEAEQAAIEAGLL
jgi:hypothetical protein